MSDDLAGQIRRNLYAIMDLYDEALEPVRRAPDSTVKSPSKEPPAPISAHILQIRGDARTDLVNWAGFILDEIRDINGNPMTNRLVAATPKALVPFIATWVDHIIREFPADGDLIATKVAEHVKALLDISGLAIVNGEIVVRAPRDWMAIGNCPVTVADPDGNSVVCGAKVRAYADRAFIACPSCGTEDTLAWWMSQIVPEGSDLAHADAVIACVTMRTFRPLSHEQIRQWAARGHIARHGKDTKGRTLYSSAAVLAYAQHQTEEDVA
jgi:hypothetical protein